MTYKRRRDAESEEALRELAAHSAQSRQPAWPKGRAIVPLIFVSYAEKVSLQFSLRVDLIGIQIHDIDALPIRTRVRRGATRVAAAPSRQSIQTRGQPPTPLEEAGY